MDLLEPAPQVEEWLASDAWLEPSEPLPPEPDPTDGLWPLQPPTEALEPLPARAEFLPPMDTFDEHLLQMNFAPHSPRTLPREPASFPTSEPTLPKANSLLADCDPVLLESSPPVYPLLARQRQWEGSLTCRLTVDPDGSVSHVTVEQSSGHSCLDQAATQALLRWRFQPAIRFGVAATTHVIHRVSFRLAPA